MSNREEWLTELANRISPIISPVAKDVFGQDWTMPNFRIAMGFPSKRALSAKSRRIGECWPSAASADGTFEIIISPMTISGVAKEEAPIRVAGVVAHELVHAADRNIHSHKGPFVKIIRRIGLAGKPTATTEGEGFIERVKPILSEMPEMPIVGINASTFKKQPTLMIKCYCGSCGYIVRTTDKWLQQAIPTCPVDGSTMLVKR